MSKNKKITICVAVVLVLLAVCLIFWLGRDKAAETPDEPDAAEQAAEPANAQPEDVKKDEPEPEKEEAEAVETESAQLIENEGDVTIIVPEGEESDGF